ncbi:MAG: hypothetical protein H0X72_19750 [Acidobacteria bacterium]|jgi:hypothetical protein|nr:hypothetical protein [Acidobacteriota bacterium]
MKTIFRFLALGILMTVFSAATVTSSFAQGDEAAAKKALYDTYIANYDKKEIDKRKIAIDAAKQYVEKYGANAADKEQVDYFKTAIPDLEKGVVEQQKLEGEAVANANQQKLFTRFDAANKAKNPAEIFASGKEILAQKPDFLDVNIVLASAGFDQAIANPPVDTYNNDVINYSKAAIQQIEAGKLSVTKEYGAINYVYKDKDNALGWMNYNIGYVMYYRQNNKKEALPFLYKATQQKSATKNFPDIYRAIGAWYLDEAIKIDKDRKAKIVAAGDKDTDETLAMLAMQKGYADRAIDAYARAYKIAKDDKNSKKEYTDNLYSRLKELYVFRYDGKIEGIDAFVATVQSKPLPDPTTAITPVKDETTTPPATTSTTTPAEPAASTTTPATPAATKPATTNSAKPATTPTKPPTTQKAETPADVSETTTTTAKTDKTKAKKTTPKKKGTR